MQFNLALFLLSDLMLKINNIQQQQVKLIIITVYIRVIKYHCKIVLHGNGKHCTDYRWKTCGNRKSDL